MSDFYYGALITDLLDEGLLPAGEISRLNRSLAADYLQNMDDQRGHPRCSVNQTSLSEWSWLIGSSGGALQPLLCRARRRDTCEATDFERRSFGMAGSNAVSAVGILFGLANLITMAVWFRCKAPANHREVSIQLLLLRALCLTGFVGLIAEWLHPWWPGTIRTRVFGVLHAALVVVAFRVSEFIYAVCQLMNITLNFLTSIYLVEHSYVAQRVLLFVSQRRTQILVGAATATCLVLVLPELFMIGYVYCVNASAGKSYVLNQAYARAPYHLAYILISRLPNLAKGLSILLTIILLIVYASKRCCACCRCSESAADTSVTVAYVRQLESPADADETAVVTELGSPTPQGSQLANELRRLLFWQLVSECAIFMAIFVHFFVLQLRVSWTAEMLVMLATHILQFSHPTIWSPILSPSYRSGFVSLFLELRNAAAGCIGGRKPAADSDDLLQHAE